MLNKWKWRSLKKSKTSLRLPTPQQVRRKCAGAARAVSAGCPETGNSSHSLRGSWMISKGCVAICLSSFRYGRLSTRFDGSHSRENPWHCSHPFWKVGWTSGEPETATAQWIKLNSTWNIMKYFLLQELWMRIRPTVMSSTTAAPSSRIQPERYPRILVKTFSIYLLQLL